MSNHVEVTGTGAATAAPDVVVIDARVQADGRDVASALSDCAALMTTVFATMDRLEIAAKDRVSTGIGVHPRYDVNGQNVVGHSGYQSFRLTVRDRNRVGEVLTALASAGGNGFALDNVSLQIADATALVIQARETAFAEARAKAEQLATLAGRTLGAVSKIVEVSAGGGGGGLRMAKMYAGGADAAMSMPVEGGESTVTASVVVRWELTE